MSYATERLIKNARSSLPGSLDNVILLELFNVLDTFFRATRIWDESVTFSVVANSPIDTIYYIEPESVSTIVALNWVQNASAFYWAASMAVPGEILLITPPGNNEIYTANVSLSIVDPVNSNGYPEFPAWILEKYGIGILDGLLGRMMAQPAKPYTNPKLAEAHLKFFDKACSIAVNEAVHRNVQGGQAWRFPQTFATRTRRR
jgi:hypothetical protein